MPLKIGRAFKNEKSSPDNGYFDCKVLSKAHAMLYCTVLYCTVLQVLSKAHAMLLYEEGRFMLVDTGSSNGTFVNNIR